MGAFAKGSESHIRTEVHPILHPEHRCHRDGSSWARPLVVSNYQRAFREVYGLQHPDVVAVVGIAFTSFPINASDALWERFELARLWDVRDPMNRKPARRNIFAAELPAEVPAMLRDAMMPNLIVPAQTMLLGLLQERGFTCEHIM